MFELLRKTAQTLRRRSVLVVIMAAVVAAAGPAWADGMIVPIDPEIRVQGHWAVKYHHVDIRVRNQVASVSIEQEFVNTGDGMIEVEYLFPVPPGAAIDSMTLMVDGKEFAATLMEADEARRIYEEIVRKKKDPALLEYAGFGLYRTRAFPLEVGKPAKVLVTYKYICKRSGATVEVWYPLNTEKFSAEAIEDVTVRIDVEAAADIANVYSPSHEMTVDRETPRRLVATYHAQNVLPTTDLQLFYSSANVDVGATLLTYEPRKGEDGYFLMLVSPNPRTAAMRIVPKDIVLVLDRSGSMSGEKIIQARAAARFVLERLNEDDRFNVIAYNDGVDVFFDELRPADEAERQEAIARVDQIDAGGGTNIHEALRQAMTAIGAAGDGNAGRRPKYVVFLTDGLPTVGNTNESVILADTKNANEFARLFAFGVGYDVNVRLLDKLTDENRGRSEHVKPDEPIESKVAALYAKIKNPVMIDLAVSMQGVKLSDIYPRELGDLFEGDQLVVTGRYSASDVAALPHIAHGTVASNPIHGTQLVLTGTYGGEERGFEYPAIIAPASKAYPFVEKLWAIRRVGWLLDQIQLSGESKEVTDELIALSLKHGIMTPYTSFLADETTDLASPAELRESADRATESLQTVTGGVGQVGATNRDAVRTADQVPADSAPSDAPATEGKKGVQVYGSSTVADYEDDEAEHVTTVRQVGNQALYRRGRQWVAANASQIDPDRDEDQIEVVDRMSEAYFDLVDANTVDENRILASQGEDEELLIALRGQVYLIK